MIYLYFSPSLWKKEHSKISSELKISARHEKQTIIFFFIFFLIFYIEKPAKAFFQLNSCAAIQQEWPQADSGYYWITIGSREVQIYCDMTSYGKP